MYSAIPNNQRENVTLDKMSRHGLKSDDSVSQNKADSDSALCSRELEQSLWRSTVPDLAVFAQIHC